MKMARAIVIGCCAALVASQAFGSLVIDLRFADGTKTKDISTSSAGDTVTIQVWATVTGANTTTTDDGLNNVLFGLLSTNATANLTGNLTAGTFVAPFDAPVPATIPGVFTSDRNGDGISDWRGAAGAGSVPPPDWPRASADVTTMILGGGAIGEANPADSLHSWEFHVADAVFTVGSLTLPSSGSVDALSYILQIPSLTLGAAKGRWREDDIVKAGTISTPTTGTGVTFTLSAVPEPGSAALASVGILCLAGYLWRKRRWPIPTAPGRTSGTR